MRSKLNLLSIRCTSAADAGNCQKDRTQHAKQSSCFVKIQRKKVQESRNNQQESPSCSPDSFPDLTEFGRIGSDDATEGESCGCKTQQDEFCRQGLTCRPIFSIDEEEDRRPDWQDIYERSTFDNDHPYPLSDPNLCNFSSSKSAKEKIVKLEKDGTVELMRKHRVY